MTSIMLKPLIPLFLVHMVKAQGNLTYLNIFWNPAPTLTLISSNDVATTYEYSCPRTTSTSPTPTSTTEYMPFLGSPSERSAQEASYISSLLAYFSTAIPAETPTRYSGGCGAPITIFQGPETYGYRLTITESSLLTLNGECTWKGVFTEVPITCDAEMKGSMYSRQFERGTPTVFQQSELRDGRTVGFAVATVVRGTGKETGTGTGDAGVAKETGAESTGSQGRAGHVVFPTGVMAMAGGAFVVGAAAWVL